jgi:O-antigen ligase
VNGAVLGLFVLLLMVSPLPLGANRDWAWSPILLAVGAIAALCAAFSGSRSGFDVSPQERRPLIWLIATFGFFLLVALVQMSTLGPATPAAAIYVRAREILGKAHAPVPTLAIDESYYSVLRCLGCALIFLIARSLCRGEREARLLLKGLLTSALIVAAYGLYMQAATHNCFAWGVQKKQGLYIASMDRCLMSGTFVGPNNFACYLGMAVVAAMALLLSAPSPIRRHRHHEDDDDDGPQWLTGSNMALGAAALTCMGGLLISGSRGGFGSTVAGIVALGFLYARSRENAGASMRRMISVGMVVGLVIIVVAGGSLLRKAATSSNNYNRVLIWKGALEAVAQSPLLGWGLGSYPDVYALNQPAEIIQPNDKAHSTPIEVLVEMGIPGGLAAMLLVLIPWGFCLRAALRGQRRHRLLPAAAFAIATVPILHSTIDFSLQIPAIAFMASAFLGLGWAHAFSYSQESTRDETFTDES